MTLRKRYAAGLIIYRYNEGIPEILLLDHNGRWSPPKGGKEAEESEMENALRETYEETGLTAADIVMIEDYRYQLSYTNSPIKETFLTLFLAKINNPNHPIVISHEHSKYLWMKLSDAILSRNHGPSHDEYVKMYHNVFSYITTHCN